MTPERWQHIKEVFYAALERPPAERACFLDLACAGDETAHREVSQLISAHEEKDKFLSTPAYEAAAGLLVEEQVRLPVGQTVGQYQITGALGAGGMGEVYLALDARLGRKVALKLLPDSFVRDAERLRWFEREARTASLLNHPNVCTIYEVGEAEAGRHFIAMEYVEGETLRARLSRERLKLPEMLEIATQIASGLAAAHALGIIHRDIKPENIMLRRDGIVKVLDFGLAKLIPHDAAKVDTQAPTRFKTGPGMVIGTANYMSPEQARGIAEDQRTDIFSLGIVLYELVAGRLPFEGSTSSEIVASILSDEEPQPLARYSREVPVELERIVSKTLRKDRDDRYQTTKDLVIDLKHLKRELELQTHLKRRTVPELSNPTSTGTSEPVTSAVAQTEAIQVAPAVHTGSSANLINQMQRHKLSATIVLIVVVIAAVVAFLYLKRQPVLTEKDTILLADFVNSTGDTSFDGSTLKQALAVQLRQTPFLNLLPEEAVRETLRYMGRAEGERITPEVGREICRRRGLKAMLVGSIASLGRNYAITLEAINGQTGETIASQQFEAEGKEQVLTSLGQAALNLRKQLGESLSTLQKYNAPIEQATTSSLEALDLYSKGLELQYGGDAQAALPLFNRAVELDPNFAEAYLWLSWTYSSLGDLRKTGDFAAKAYTLRDRVTELEKLHIDEIYHLFTTGDFEKQKEADVLIKRLYPNDSLAPASLGFGYIRIGQLEQALTEFRVAIRINPNESHYYGNLSDILIRLNRFDEARETIKEARTRNIDHASYRRNLYLISLAQGDDIETQQQLAEIRKIDGEAAALTREAGAAIFAGRWRKAQELYHRAAALTGTPSPSGTNSTLPVGAAIAGALFGYCNPATNDIRRTLTISRLSSPVQILYVPVLANGSLCGDTAEAQKLADEQLRRYPDATLVSVYSQPIIRAAIALQRDHADQAVELLNAAIPYEGGAAGFWPDYLRGQAYLRKHLGNEAAAEFQKILDHRGWDVPSPMYPLAQLGVARAAMLVGDVTKARNAYQGFFALWKDADPDIPILIEAKKEFEKLI